MQRMTAGTDALIESDELGIVSCGGGVGAVGVEVGGMG